MTQKICINFHGIGNPARDFEPGEERYWISEAMFLDILDRISSSEDSSRYVITFDDGNLSDITIGLPALLERGLEARFFVLTGRLNDPGSLSTNHLQQIADAGMKIGSHGIDHLSWPTLNDEMLTKEVGDSRLQLENILGLEIDEAGIPFGHYDARVLRALKRAGYQVTWSSDGGSFKEGAYPQSRTSVRNDMSALELESLLADRVPFKRRLRRMIGITRRKSFPLF